MCGHVGVAGNLIARDVTVFKELLYADYVRGVDSTGIASITHNNEVRLFKMPVKPTDLLDMKYTGDLVNIRAKVLMGHNRAATRGVVNIANSHPFWTGRYMVTHNGTLDYTCLKDLAKNKDGNTDSEQLAQSMHDLGSVKDALALASGAWSLVIYDAEDGTINFVRNDKRPFYYAFAADRDTLYWASEARMLQWVLERNNVDYNKKIYDLSVDTLLTWAVPDSKHVFAEKPVRLEAKGKSVTPFQSNVQDWTGQRQYAGHSNYNAPKTSPTGNGGSSKSGTSNNSGRDAEHSTEYSVDDIKKLRSAPFAEVEWEIYGLGYCDAIAALSRNNPFHYQTDFDKWDQYETGFNAATETAKVREAVVENKIDDSLPFLLGTSIKEEAVKKKSNVILVGDLKPKEVEAPRKSNVHLWPMGPKGLRVSPAKFSELTKGCCSWCDEKLKDHHDGKWENLTHYGDMFVCTECLKDDDYKIFTPESKKA